MSTPSDPPSDPHSEPTRIRQTPATPPPSSPPPSSPPPSSPPPSAPPAPPGGNNWPGSPPPPAPPGYGAPGFGPPGPGGPGKPSGSRTPWILGAVGIVLLVVIGTIGAFLVLGGDDSDDERSSGDDPTNTSTSDTEPTDEPSVATPTAEASTVTPPPDTTDLAAVVGTWKGTYVCAQGRTALTLSITPTGDAPDTVEAIFAFGPTKANPEVPDGSYFMEGTYADGFLDLDATEWIQQPEGYFPVDMSAEVTEDAGVLEGTIDDPSCSTFDLTEQ